MKTKIIPFNLETAKKIQAGKIEGKIRTERGEEILLYKNDSNEFKCWIHEKRDSIHIAYGDSEVLNLLKLYLEVPDNEPQFKPFDKVLVRKNDDDVQYWQPKTYSFFHPAFKEHVMTDGMMYAEVLPYEGNENLVGTITKHTHLVGTTDKPKED